MFSWRIRLAAYGARLERVLGSRPRGFKSPILRSSPGLDFLRPGIFLSGAWARQLQEPQLFLMSLCCGPVRAAMRVAGQFEGLLFRAIGVTHSEHTVFPRKIVGMIFKKVGAHRPYPQHGMSNADWGSIPPQQVRLDWLTTTQKTLDLETLLAEDSTYFGDLFPHVVKWQQELYLEDGLHRALRTALHSRSVMYARILDLDTLDPRLLPQGANAQNG